MSDLEQNILQPYGENEFTFDQNTVPFDFDGKRLLWLTYKDGDIRELNQFVFDQNKVELINRFKKGEGMISHVKYLKTNNPERKIGKYIFWVLNTNSICRFNIEEKKYEIVASVPDSILCMNVTMNTIKSKEREYLEKMKLQQLGDVVEDLNEVQEECTITCIDESENLHIIKLSENSKNKETFNLKTDCKMDDDLKQKDLFGMGYPYFI